MAQLRAINEKCQQDTRRAFEQAIALQSPPKAQADLIESLLKRNQDLQDTNDVLRVQLADTQQELAEANRRLRSAVQGPRSGDDDARRRKEVLYPMSNRDEAIADVIMMDVTFHTNSGELFDSVLMGILF